MNMGLLSIGFMRPEMHTLSLQSLKECRGYKDLYVRVVLDKAPFNVVGRENLEKILPNADFREREQPLGMNGNVLISIQEMFNDGYDSVIVLEEDIVVSKDFLEFHRYCHEEFDWEDLNVMCCTGYTRSNGSSDKIHLYSWYIPDGVSWKKSTWNMVVPHIPESYRMRFATIMEFKLWMLRIANPTFRTLIPNIKKHEPDYMKEFTVSEMPKCHTQDGLLNAIRASKGMKTLSPESSRCQDIGIYGQCQPKGYEKIADVTNRDNWTQSGWYTEGFKEDHEWTDLELKV